MKYINSDAVFNGDREFENEEVNQHLEFKKYYAAGNTIYYFYIDEISWTLNFHP